MESVPKITRAEIQRKLFHLTPGVLALALPFAPHRVPTSWITIGIVAAIVLFLVVTFMIVCGRRALRPGERSLVGPTVSYGAVILLALTLFRENLEFTVVVAIVIALGDAAAFSAAYCWEAGAYRGPTENLDGPAVLHRRGRTGRRAGLLDRNRPSARFAAAVACGFAAALAGSLAESLPVRANDNLRVGLAALLTVATVHFAVL